MRTPRLPSAFLVTLMLVSCAITVALYAPGLGGPLLFDDFASLRALLRADELPPDWPAYVFSNTGPLGRPVSMLSFLANTILHGDRLIAWKATNLVLHCANGALIFIFSVLLFLRCSECSPRLAYVAGFFVSAWWLWHPLQVSTVLYTVQRMTQLSTYFCLTGALLYAYTRLRSQDSVIARLRLWVVYVVCLPLAALSKEIGLLLPAFIFVLEFTALDRRGDPDLRRHARLLLLPFLLLPVLIVIAHYSLNFDTTLWAANARRGYTPWERLLTQTRVLVDYLGQILAPSRVRLGFFHDDIVISKSLFSPPTTAISSALLVALAATAVAARRRMPLFAAGVLWFFAGHLLESTVIPLEMMFEHRNYLPSTGILLAVTAVALHWLPRATLLSAPAIAILALNAFVTASVVHDWSNEVRMYQSFYAAHPGSPNAASQYAEILSSQGKFRRAQAVLEPLPGAGAALHRWYLTCRETGRLSDSALDHAVLDRDRVLTTYAATGLIELTNLAIDRRCELSLPRLRALLTDALSRPTGRNANHQKLSLYAAHLAWAAQDQEGAYQALERAIDLKPGDPVPLLLLSEWKLEAGDRSGAERALARAEAVAAVSPRDHRALLEAVRTLLQRDSASVRNDGTP